MVIDITECRLVEGAVVSPAAGGRRAAIRLGNTPPMTLRGRDEDLLFDDEKYNDDDANHHDDRHYSTNDYCSHIYLHSSLCKR